MVKVRSLEELWGKLLDSDHLGTERPTVCRAEWFQSDETTPEIRRPEKLETRKKRIPNGTNGGTLKPQRFLETNGTLGQTQRAAADRVKLSRYFPST